MTWRDRLRYEWDCLYGWVFRCRNRDPESYRMCIKRRGHGPAPHTDGLKSWGADERGLRLGERATVPHPLDRRRR